MALAAFRELLVDPFGMRQTMAVRTSRNGLVLALVAGHTGELAMLSLACSQRRVNRIVTSGTQSGGRGVRVHQLERLVRFVAGRAVVLRHRLGMRFMAVRTGRHAGVGISMAEVTSEGCVLAGAGLHLLDRTGVTGVTNLLLLALDGDVQRLVRVMAIKAGNLDFVMGATLVAVAALRNIVG